ncbi:aromatic ring-hydroxylating dioxygenase subunit alpha [Sphingomonas sp.]|uniref:aromatic ring-hydroxylating oxygenase subunit alpha n=1 Tax=Sphingomonas sp. TaxID=28214 RepID=UPI000DB2C53A|nr:aromatic ring-hydroxylating dioxygenase subunit alpha [Sphingomonas sp.]PZU07233.1 MAG: (2Fe-2S)-binding protein [Sphingomonas sp.]
MLDTLKRRVLPRGCTFDEGDWHILSRHWYPVALVREVDAGAVPATLLDEQLIVYRSADGAIVVANDICPHRGVPLSMGSYDGASVACAYHGLRFGAEGRCIKIPAHPDRSIPSQFHLATYPMIEAYGLVWTCLAPDEHEPAMLPPMPHWTDPGFQQIICPWMDIFGFAGRQLEGFLDVAHFGFVHADTFGDPDNVKVPDYKPVRHTHGFEVEYRSSVGNYPIGAVERGREGFEWLRHFNVHLPFTATLVVHFPEGGRLVIMNAASPVSARHTRLFAPIARNFDTDLPVQDVYDFNARIFAEDKAIVETQRPECLPLDPVMEAHFPADRSSMAYRRGLRDMGLSRFFIA